MRFNNLTFARFFAAMLVYFHHSMPVENLAITSKFWHNFTLNSHIGVSFFFIVSGFVLSAANLDRLGTLTLRGSLEFYWKRIARIVPLWLFCSLVPLWYAYQVGDRGLIPFLTFTQAWYGDIFIADAVLAVAWTLSVEMFFYAIFPFIAVWLRRFTSDLTGPALMLIGISIPAAGALYFHLHPELATLPWDNLQGSHRWLYRFPPARLGEFLAGIGAYLTIARGAVRLGKPMTITCIAGLAIILFECMGRTTIGGAMWVFPYVVLLSGIVLLLAHLEGLGVAVTGKTPILLGEASFALYLTHFQYMKANLVPPLVLIGGLRLTQLTVLVLSVSVSIGLFLVVETPCRILLLKLLRVRSTTPVATVVETGEELPIAEKTSG